MIAVYKTLKIVLLHTQVEVSLVNLTQSRVTLEEPQRGAVCIRLACGGEKACTSLWLEGPGCTGVSGEGKLVLPCMWSLGPPACGCCNDLLQVLFHGWLLLQLVCSCQLNKPFLSYSVFLARAFCHRSRRMKLRQTSFI